MQSFSSPSVSRRHTYCFPTSFSTNYHAFLLFTVVLFTRAYAVWGATRHTLYFLALVYAVSALSSLRAFKSEFFIFKGRDCRNILFDIFVPQRRKPTRFVVAYFRDAIGFDKVLIECFSLAIGIQNGCLFQIANDDLWIALAILVFCESCESYPHLFRSL